MITFFRRPDNSKTECFLLPFNQETIEQLVDNYVRGVHTYTLHYGATRYHTKFKEKYCKKVGREEAQKKVLKHKMNIKIVLMNDKEVHITLVSKETNITVKMYKDSGRIRCY